MIRVSPPVVKQAPKRSAAQALHIPGFLGSQPTHFQRLALAGRMMKEAGSARGQASENAAPEALLAGAHPVRHRRCQPEAHRSMLDMHDILRAVERLK